MSVQKIVIVEDEPDILEMLSYNLRREQFDVVEVSDGAKAVAVIQKQLPNVVLLDLMLPGMDGLEICRQLKSNETTANIAIIMVTAKGEESDIVLGLGMGADDYISKPFSPKELIARVKALVRRSAVRPNLSNPDIIEIDGLKVDSSKHRVKMNDVDIILTATEFRILHHLAAKPGQVFTRDQLMDQTIGNDAIVVDRNIDVHIRAIRKKLGEENLFIETIRGVGYRFKEPVQKIRLDG